jgi:hypothetical protein
MSGNVSRRATACAQSTRKTYSPLLGETSAQNDNTPTHGDEGKPSRGTQFPQGDVAGNFEEEVGDKENKQHDRVTVADIES